MMVGPRRSAPSRAVRTHPGHPRFWAGRRTRRAARVFAGCLGVWLLILAAEAAPHLVHHAFDEGGEQPDCAFLVAADHAPAVAGAVAMVAVAHVLLKRIDPPR